MTRPDPHAAVRARVGRSLNGKWTLDRLIDVGGMAAVYAATHRNGKRVAVKVLHAPLAANREIRERFLREGYVANKIEHRGTVSVIDDDTTPEGEVYLVMDLLEGESLETALKKAGGTLRLADALAVADQVLDVLHAFHGAGVIHRDIKPANIYLTTDGVVKVLDFGLARLRDSSQTRAPTAQGTILGTAAYMAPEQARGAADEIDARTDVFSVGAVLFHALSGRVVHPGESMTERLIHAMKVPVVSVASVAPGLSPWVAQIVDRACAFDRAARWESAGAMRDAVRDAFASVREQANLAPKPEAHALVPDGGDVSAMFDAIVEPSAVIEVSFADILSVDDEGEAHRR